MLSEIQANKGVCLKAVFSSAKTFGQNERISGDLKRQNEGILTEPVLSVFKGFFILTSTLTGTTRLAEKPHFLKRPKTKTVPVTVHSSFESRSSLSAPFNA
jgi:hypothetical protein